MEYMDDYAPAPMEYYFGTSKKAVACSTDGTKRYFRIDIRCDASSEKSGLHDYFLRENGHVTT